MGAGIVLPRERIIEIARRELDRTFIEYDTNRRLVDDNGFLLPESFDREEEYRENIRYLKYMLRKIEWSTFLLLRRKNSDISTKPYPPLSFAEGVRVLV